MVNLLFVLFNVWIAERMYTHAEHSAAIAPWFYHMLGTLPEALLAFACALAYYCVVTYALQRFFMRRAPVYTRSSHSIPLLSPPRDTPSHLPSHTRALAHDAALLLRDRDVCARDEDVELLQQQP